MPTTVSSNSDNESAMRKTLLESRKFLVERREYPRSGEKPVVRDIVVHPGAVVVLPVLDDGRIVLIHQHRHAVETDLIELPAGTIEPDEPPIETARRELVEETGYKAETMEPFIEFFTSPGVLTERMYSFIARGLTFVGQDLGPTERITVEPLPPHDVRTRLIANDIQDGKSIAVLTTYFLNAQG